MPAPLWTGLRQVALQRDTNILVYGVLQFSASLHDLYDTTAQKLDRIWHSIGIHEQRLTALHRQTQRAQKDQKEIRELVEGVKAKNTVLQQQTWSNKKMLQKVLVGHQDLSQRVKGVEEVLASMEERRFPDKGRGFPALQWHAGLNSPAHLAMVKSPQGRGAQLIEKRHTALSTDPG
ncbi:hypothetical protein lerEdw1_002159 [Lerista edwardsae]|nr:hypothetical protein lerEdw1_002159 [Lerista edwardsae]